MDLKNNELGYNKPNNNNNGIYDDSAIKEINSQLEQKVNKTDLDSKVWSMSNMGQDVIEAMTGGSGAVVDCESILEEHIANNQVTISKTDFISCGQNLFDKDNSKNIVGQVIKSNGSFGVFETGVVSHPIDVKPMQEITAYFDKKNYGSLALAYFYNAKGEFVLSETPTYVDGTKYGTFVVPSNSDIRTMRLNIRLSDINSAMCVLGNTYPDEFVPFEYVLSDKFTLTKKMQESILNENKNYKDNSISFTKTDFIVQSKNIFNPSEEFEINKYIYNYGESLSDLTGDYAVSYYIPCEPGKTYTAKSFYSTFSSNSVKINLYNYNKEFIEQIRGVNNENGTLTFTIPTNLYEVRYFRYNIKPSDINNIMVVEGEIYPDEFIKYKLYLKEDFEFNDTQINYIKNFNTSLETNKLYNKTIVFDGDSICEAKTDTDNKSGWAGRIGIKNNMIWKNYGISGGTIASETYTSGETKRHWINENIDNIITEYPNADYLIFEGGTNDADLLDDSLLGSISDSYAGDYDNTTFIGALETLFYKAIINYKGKKIGFIIAHKMGAMNSGKWETSKRRQFFNEVIKVCEKWGIPYLDLWNNCYLCSDIPEIRSEMYVDSQHLSNKGYDYISDMIESWIRTL